VGHLVDDSCFGIVDDGKTLVAACGALCHTAEHGKAVQ
jgi:hypothetical protein